MSITCASTGAVRRRLSSAALRPLRGARLRAGRRPRTRPRRGLPRTATLPVAARVDLLYGQMRLVPPTDVAANDRARGNGADPFVEIARQFRVAVVPIRHQRPERGRILPRLEHENPVGVRKIEGRLG